jgi:protein tyrosine phosphatase
LNYRYQVKVEQDKVKEVKIGNKILNITSIDPSGKISTSQQIIWFHIDVKDNASINPSDFLKVKALWNCYSALIQERSKGDYCLYIHCASGVGRTGQVHLLFRLLDEMNEKDSQLKPLVTKIMQELISSDGLNKQEFNEILTEKEINQFADKIEYILSTMRAVRYSIQTDVQLYNIPKLLILLHYFQLNPECTQDQFNQIQQQLPNFLPPPLERTNSLKRTNTVPPPSTSPNVERKKPSNLGFFSSSPYLKDDNAHGIQQSLGAGKDHRRLT